MTESARWIAAWVLLVLAPGGFARAAEWFVAQKAPMADDRHPGTEAKPFKTIQPAVDAAKSGDTIYVKEGIYSDRVRLRGFGRPTHPSLLTAWKEDRVVIGSELRELPAADHWQPIDGRKSYRVPMPADTPDDLIVILDGRPIVTQRKDAPPAGIRLGPGETPAPHDPELYRCEGGGECHEVTANERQTLLSLKSPFDSDVWGVRAKSMAQPLLRFSNVGST